MEGESFISFAGVSVMLAAVLMLFYQAGRGSRRPQRTAAFVVLVLGELMLFPWESPVEWLRVGIIAAANMVVGADRRVLDGVFETIRDLLRRPPRGGAGGGTAGGVGGVGGGRADGRGGGAVGDAGGDAAGEGVVPQAEAVPAAIAVGSAGGVMPPPAQGAAKGVPVACRRAFSIRELARRMFWSDMAN